MTIQKIAIIRQKELSSKYLDESGMNTGLYCRDNVEDILEECADILSIMDLFGKRLSSPITKMKYEQNKHLQYVCGYLTMLKHDIIEYCNKILKVLDNEGYPSELRKEDIERIGFDEIQGKEKC